MNKDQRAAVAMTLVFGALAVWCGYWAVQSVVFSIEMSRTGDRLASNIGGAAMFGSTIGVLVFGFFTVCCVTGITAPLTPEGSDDAR